MKKKLIAVLAGVAVAGIAAVAYKKHKENKEETTSEEVNETSEDVEEPTESTESTESIESTEETKTYKFAKTRAAFKVLKSKDTKIKLDTLKHGLKTGIKSAIAYVGVSILLFPIIFVLSCIFSYKHQVCHYALRAIANGSIKFEDLKNMAIEKEA